jgi:hypothetical protein
VCRATARRCIYWTSIISRVRPTRSTGCTRQCEDCHQDVTWSGWYLRERNECTRKLRSAFMATPIQSSETVICGLFQDELSRLSLSLSPPARTCLKPVVLEGSAKDSGWRSRSRSVSIPFDRRCPMAKAPCICGLKPLVNGVSRHRGICVLLEDPPLRIIVYPLPRHIRCEAAPLDAGR